MTSHEPPAVDVALADDDAGLPLAEVRATRGLSLFWLIPLSAALVAAWLAWDAQRSRGPEIAIVFKRGEGVEAGKTTIRYKAVEVGQVIGVGISSDLKSITVRARINLDFAEHLSDKTRFWVVSPRIGAQGISGLNTLVSGTYIEVDPAPGTPARDFVALDAPPIVPSDAPGRAFLLHAHQLGNIQAGSPVSFKDVAVGEVLGYELSVDGREVAIHVFVREPYAPLVRENSRFWIASGLNLSIGADGVDFRTPSLQEVLLGGIKFDSSLGDERPAAAAGTEYELFEEFEAIAEAGFTQRVSYVLYFDESVRGLSAGAPVEFRGIKLGEVAEIGLELEQAELKPQIPVVVNVHPQRFGFIDDANSGSAESLLQTLIDHGLRARLQTGNLLTGQLYIELAIEPKSKAVYVTGKRDLPQIPTLPTEFGEFKNNANAMLAELRRFPLADVGKRAVAALSALERRLDDPEIDQVMRAATASFKSVEQLAGEFERSIAPLRTDIATALATLRDGSPLRAQLHETLRQVDATARAIRELSNEIERQPQSVIWGKDSADE